MHEAEGVPLPGGRMTSGLVRHGDRVRRPTGPWSPAVHEHLRHLASAGFEGSPRVLATGDGWEELTYLEGEVAFDPDWKPGRGNRLPPQARTDRALAGAGWLLRALHEAAAGFEPRWSSWPASCAGSTASPPTWPAPCEARLTGGGLQVQAALLDDQAAVFHVEQPGVLGDGPGLGRGDAQLQPQGSGARRDRLASDVRRLA